MTPTTTDDVLRPMTAPEARQRLTLPCQFCRGKGKTGPVHINRGNAPHEWRESMDCHHCAGTGRWTPERHARWEAGQAMRAERIARDESLREAAKRLGISPARLSAIETGRAALDTERSE